MPTKPGREPKLYALDKLPDGVGLRPEMYESHPDGQGGYRPTNAANRGTLNVTCPHCAAPLARDVHAEYLKVSIFQCGVCHKQSAGERYSEATGWET